MQIMQIVAFLFYLMIALQAFGIGFPFLAIILGVCAAILAVKSLI